MENRNIVVGSARLKILLSPPNFADVTQAFAARGMLRRSPAHLNSRIRNSIAFELAILTCWVNSYKKGLAST